MKNPILIIEVHSSEFLKSGFINEKNCKNDWSRPEDAPKSIELTIKLNFPNEKRCIIFVEDNIKGIHEKIDKYEVSFDRYSILHPRKNLLFLIINGEKIADMKYNK